jgi:hypothetical protein
MPKYLNYSGSYITYLKCHLSVTIICMLDRGLITALIKTVQGSVNTFEELNSIFTAEFVK